MSSTNIITVAEGLNKVVCRDFKIFSNFLYICGQYYLLNRWIAVIYCYDLQGNLQRNFGQNGKVVLTSLNNSTESFNLLFDTNSLYIIGTSRRNNLDGFICKLNRQTGAPVNNFGQNSIRMIDAMGRNDFVVDSVINNNQLYLLGYTIHNGYYSMYLINININNGNIIPIQGSNTILNGISFNYINQFLLISSPNKDLDPKALTLDNGNLIICGGIRNNTTDSIAIQLSSAIAPMGVIIEDYQGKYDINNQIVVKDSNKYLGLATVTNPVNLNIVRIAQYNKSPFSLDNTFNPRLIFTQNMDLYGKSIIFRDENAYVLCNAPNNVYIFCVKKDGSYTTLRYLSTGNKSLVGNYIILNNFLYVIMDFDKISRVYRIDTNIFKQPLTTITM